MTTRICIGIPTFCRIDSLRTILSALGNLVPPGDSASVEITVFDNDPAGSAKPLVTNSVLSVPFDLHYRHVSPPGLSSVRNAALRFAAAHADLLAMIDDDEIPEPQWLNELLRVRAETGAAVVVGPVLAILPDDAPAWMRAFREHELPTHEDGASLSDGWSGNFLIDLGKVAAMDLQFDSAMNRTGGEDQLFFRQFLARGGVIRYAADATVWETLPASRRSVLSILRQSFRRGGCLTICDRRIKGSFDVMLLRFAKGSASVALGVATVIPLFVVRGPSAAVPMLCEIARGLGMLAAFVGFRYAPYGRSGAA